MRDASEQQPLSRRDFNRWMAGAGAAAVLPGWAAGPPGREAAHPEGTYVDFHTHLGQTWGNRPALSAGALVHWMNERGIAQAVVHPLESPEAWDHPVPTHYVLEQTETYRHRLIPAAYTDPRAIDLWGGGRANVAALLRRYVAAGARVFGEHNPGLPLADPLSMALYASIAEVGLPVLFRMDALINTDAPGLPGLEKVLQAYPDTAFVGHGPVFWAAISGDAARTPAQATTRVAPGGALVRLMERYPNLYGSLGGESGAQAIARDPAHGRDFVLRFADRLVWGSAYAAPGQPVRQFDLYRGLDLPEDVRRKVFRDNARRLIGMI